MATSDPITRAYAPHKPTWQRFHEYAAPIASSSGAGSAAAASTSHNPYTRQYSHVYHARLSALRERCIANAKCALKDEGMNEEVNVAEKIIEVKENVWSIIVGTIVKEVDPKRRPQVETKYNDASDAQSFLFPIDGTKKKGEDEQESLKSYMFDTEKGDVLHLEDESGRVELESDSQDGACDDKMEDGSPQQKTTNGLDPNRVATGVVAAVVGKVCATKGIMKVHSIHFAGPGTTNDTKSSATTELRGPTVNNDKQDEEEEEPILLLVSGLECGSDSPTDAETGASLALRREMLLEYLTDPTLSNGASVCRVIVAGGGVSRPIKSSGEGEFDKENSKKKGYKTNAAAAAKSKSKFSDATQQMSFSLRELDLYLSELLSSGIPVDYVPGWHDPTNANWPQRPLHSCLLPLSSAYVDLFSRGTNPYEGILGGGDNENDGVKVLGSDGLNIADLRRFLTKSESKETSKDEDEKESSSDKVFASSCIDALNQTLKYGHMAPTGPDSLPTFPSSEFDPFVINSKPSVYFAGNCDEFETRLVDANGEEASDGKAHGKDVTRLVCVPSFALTGEVVLVKLKSLECEVLSFNDATL